MKRHGSMNRRYRLVWSTVRGGWVVTAETARGTCRGCASAAVGTVLVLAGALTPQLSQAGPQDGQVTAGSASITQAGSTTTITQSSQNVSLTWKSFNTLPQEKVNFVQPSASAIAVNRILDTNGTQFLGQLNANGQVYLINPNGVLFGAGAQVNVGGLVASTLNPNDAELNASQRTFSGSGAGSVVNQGTINTPAGGYVALIGNTASNQGTINTPQGTAALGAGNTVTLTFQNNQLLKVVVDQSVLNSLADNGGLIRADGGAVFMSAGARDSLLASVVSNSGVVQARTVENRNGTIVLLGGMAAGTTLVGGTLDASAPEGGNGGFIETSAAHVRVADGTRVTTLAPAGKTGTWLIDPNDFIIAASGGNMTGAQLSSTLATTDQVITTATMGTSGGNGDIFVNDAVSWGANTTLTLNAQNNININADITASGASGKVALEYGQSTAGGSGSSYAVSNGAKINLQAGNNFSTKQGSGGPVYDYTVITSLGTAGSTTGTDLQGINGALGARYALGADIDASATSSWNSGAGFVPLGTSTTRFTGTFDGLGHTISGLTINRSTSAGVGLFGNTGTSSLIANVGLLGGSVRGQTKTGALVGWSQGLIDNVYATTNVVGTASETGGLVGLSHQGSIRNSHASGTVSGNFSVGGLVGWNQTTISNSYATGTVTATSQRVGGLVGDMLNGGSISNSYASGNVSSTNQQVGGLVGFWNSNGVAASISNSYASGTVSGTSNIGGLVGYKDATAGGTIANSYATGAISGTSNLGGLVGLWSAGTAINNSFWNTTTTGQASSSGGGLGMTTAQMQQQANFTSATVDNGNVNPGWNFSTVWRMYDGYTYPLLKAFMKAATVTTNASKDYDAQAWSGGSYTCATGIGICNNGLLLGSMTYGGTAQGAVNAGTYTLSGSGLYSSQLGYDLSYASGTLNITPKTVTVTGASAANKVYDANTSAAVSGGTVSGLVGSETLTLTQNGSFDTKNVGTGKTVTLTFALADGGNGGLAGNYVLQSASGTTTANITPASLTVSGVSAANKVYDATTTAILNGTATVTALGSDTATVGGTASATFADAGVGTNKPVTVTGYILAGADAGNYIIVQPSGLTASITAVPVQQSSVSPPIRDALLPSTDAVEASSILVIRHGSSPQDAMAAGQVADPTLCAQAAPATAGATSAGRNPLLQVVDGGVCTANRPLYANK